jgi:hypothetical protein
VPGEEALGTTLERLRAGAVLVHGDLFEDDLTLHLHVLGTEGRTQQAQQQLRQGRALLGKHRAIVEGAFVAGVGVVAGAELVEGTVEFLGVAPSVALEGQVLEEVRDAGLVGASSRAPVSTMMPTATDRAGVRSPSRRRPFGSRVWSKG